MQTQYQAAHDLVFLEALAELMMHAGRDRAADAIYAAIEAEAAPARPVALRLVHNADN